MKRSLQIFDLTPAIQPLKWPVFVFILVSLLSPLWVSAQTDNGPVSINMKSISWKAAPEADLTLTAEKERIDIALSTPDISPVDQSVYKACKLMLTYIQGHIDNNVPMEDAITKGYQQVMNEAPKNPELAQLPDHMLGTYLPGLVEMLTAATVPEPR